MSKEKYDPYKGFRELTGMWEKQMNSLLLSWSDNTDYIKLSNVGLQTHTRYIEMLKRNQEIMASFMNMPTKTDVKNVAKLTIQAEEKIDALEEQIWNLQDSFSAINKENMEFFGELVGLSKQMKEELDKNVKELRDAKKVKSDLQKLRKELSDTNELRAELQELKRELSEVNGLKMELQELKQELVQYKETKNKEAVKEKKELELAGAGTGK
ncbi:polyhydroxyalkanoate biosynthesis repressor PhaR [Mesobacillus maritimus]|uniref:polyhydroxyalkanoate biosynthesis repressor PhaR n=1 Tax=Mesobacillus maritimus TaxID=1643336 RepID=UPI00384BBBA4